MKQYLSDLFHFSRGVRWFVITEALLGTGFGLYALLLNLHLLALGLDEGQIGAVSSFGTICMGIASVPCGLLANRYGRKRLLVLGLVLIASGYGVFAWGTSMPALVVAQFLQAAGMSFLVTTEIQLLYSYSKSQREETQAVSILFAVYTLFTGVGTMGGGYLPGVLGGSSTSYQWTLLLAGGIVLAGGITRLLLLPPEEMPCKKEKQTAHTDRGQVGKQQLWSKPGRTVWIFCGMNVLLGIAVSFIEPFANVIVKFRMDWTDEAVSMLLTANGFVLFLGSFLMPLLLERLGFRRAYRITFAVNLAAVLALAWSMPAGMFSVLMLARGGVFLVINNMILTHTMSVLPEHERNSYAGLRQVTRGIGNSAAVYAAGLMLSDKHYGLPFALSAVFTAAAYLYYDKWVKPLLAPGLDEMEKG